MAEFRHDWFFADEYGISKQAVLLCYLGRFIRSWFYDLFMPALAALPYLIVTGDILGGFVLAAAYHKLIGLRLSRVSWLLHFVCLSVAALCALSANQMAQLAGFVVMLVAIIELLSAADFKSRWKQHLAFIGPLLVYWIKFHVTLTMVYHLFKNNTYDPFFVAINSVFIHMSNATLGLILLGFVALSMPPNVTLERIR
jgi:hypothetical protein